MKSVGTLISMLLVLLTASAPAAEKSEIVHIGSAEVFYDYQMSEFGTAILTFNAVVNETNNSLRGLKNNDRRRLSKLGQLIYQCKLMLYHADKTNRSVEVDDPILISKNYSLFTGVDIPLEIDERIGVRAQALGIIDDSSLFTPSLGGVLVNKDISETLAEGSALNLKQFDVSLLGDTDLIESSESIDVTVRFPVYQIEKPVNQWFYSFNLTDFNKALDHIEKNCTPVKLVEMINQDS